MPPELWIGIFVGIILGAAIAVAATWYFLKPRTEEALNEFNQELERRRESPKENRSRS
jgi:F0F1-type ATP synthase membrane subunit b/b'